MRYRIWLSGCFGMDEDKQRRVFETKESAQEAADAANREGPVTMDHWEVSEDYGACPGGSPHKWDQREKCRRCEVLAERAKKAEEER